MTSQTEDERRQDKLELQPEEIKDLDVADPAQDDVRGGNSGGLVTSPATASR
jgi:hypothetical protein